MTQDRSAANKTQGKRRGFQPGNPWRFKPGNKASPGRPRKELSLTSLAKAALEADPKLAEKMVKTWLDQVLAGMTDARRDLQDRLEGKVTQPVGGPQGGPIVIKVVYEPYDDKEEKNEAD